MNEIVLDGKIVARSKNLRGVYRYARVHVRMIDLRRHGPERGIMHVSYLNGATCAVAFASFDVMRAAVARWRNCYRALLLIDGQPNGLVAKDNRALQVQNSKPGQCPTGRM